MSRALRALRSPLGEQGPLEEPSSFKPCAIELRSRLFQERREPRFDPRFCARRDHQGHERFDVSGRGIAHAVGTRKEWRGKRARLELRDDRRALSLADVAAPRFPGRCGIAERTEQIVAQLEGDAERPRKRIERRANVGRSAGEDRSHGHGTTHCIAARLQVVHRFDGRRALGSGPNVDQLTDDHARLDARKFPHGLRHPLWRYGRLAQRFERERRGVVPREDPRDIPRAWRSEPLPQHRVHARSAATHVVVVHPVVVDEEVRLEELDRDEGHGHRRRASARLVGRREKHGPDPLSAACREGLNGVRHDPRVGGMPASLRSTGGEPRGKVGVHGRLGRAGKSLEGHGLTDIRASPTHVRTSVIWRFRGGMTRRWWRRQQHLNERSFRAVEWPGA